MQGGITARLLTAQQVHIEPGRWWRRLDRGVTLCQGTSIFTGTREPHTSERGVVGWRPQGPDCRAPENQWETWTHIHLDQGHCAVAGVPLISGVWEMPRAHGPEDQGAPSSQRAGTIPGTPKFPGTVESQKS